GHVGRELGNDRQARHFSHCGNYIERAVQTAAERDAAFLDVGARDVQLEGSDALGIRKNPGKLDVLVNRASANVDDDSRAAIAQLGELLGDESPHADALQSNGVQHAGGRLDNPGCRVTFALGEEEAFHRDAAKRCQVDDI